MSITLKTDFLDNPVMPEKFLELIFQKIKLDPNILENMQKDLSAEEA